MWMEERRGTRINRERTRQALATEAETVAVGCPFCMVMIRDGLAEEGAGEAVQARDIAELLAEAAIPAERALPVLQ
jgi:Fe-S oxidoreductase